jgi:hypothetical protein
MTCEEVAHWRQWAEEGRSSVGRVRADHQWPDQEFDRTRSGR